MRLGPRESSIGRLSRVQGRYTAACQHQGTAINLHVLLRAIRVLYLESFFEQLPSLQGVSRGSRRAVVLFLHLVLSLSLSLGLTLCDWCCGAAAQIAALSRADRVQQTPSDYSTVADYSKPIHYYGYLELSVEHHCPKSLNNKAASRQTLWVHL